MKTVGIIFAVVVVLFVALIMFTIRDYNRIWDSFTADIIKRGEY